MLLRKIINKYLPTTAKSTKHPRAQAMKSIVDGIAAAQGDEVVYFEVKNGVAYIQTRRDETLSIIERQFSTFPGLEITTENAVEADFKANQAAQKKADRMKANIAKRKEEKHN